jgi:hypothetical protein
MKRIFFIVALLQLSPLFSWCQDLALGQWRVHLPFIRAKMVADAGSKIYCGSERGLFYYNRNDNSVVPLSKISGLSELTASTIGFDSETQTLLVGYINANIDLLSGNKIVNLPDIKRKNLPGDKNIYGVAFRNKLAYLACGFGIVVVDLVKNEIKDTYIIGPNGTEVKVYDIAFSGNDIFAAADNGVYRADVNNPSLVNFANWSLSLPDIGAGDFNIIETFNGRVFANYTNSSGDVIHMFDGSSWINPPPSPFNQPAATNYEFRTSSDRMLITNNNSVRAYDQNLNVTTLIDNGVYADPLPQDAIYDQSGTIWVADNQQGLVKISPSLAYEFIFPDGPQSDLVSAMQIINSRLLVTHATRTALWFNTYEPGKYSEYYKGDWKTFNNKTVTGTPYNIDHYFDMMSLAIDPSNFQHAFIGSKGQGVVETMNGIPIASYRDTNSTLQIGIGNPTQCQAVGMGFDTENNLWVLNSLAARPVNVRTPDGTWKAYSIPGIAAAPLYGDMTIDSYGQKWINVLGNNTPLGTGLVVFNDNGTLDDITDDKSRFYTTGVGKGNLPSTGIRAITEDRENEIWLGTEKGVAVIYSPSSVTTAANFDAQQILIKQDGINQYLLESEVVTAIAVDGANRKWIGTEAGGVFLMSPDGTSQILNFNENNSPLLSNFILAITIDQKTGEVFLGTNRGLISYKGDAIEGEGACHDVLAYPNPVRENYSGPIAIKGLVPNGSVKITDVSGNIVYETKANGTQAIWYGKNFSGEKAHTGVYLVFSTDDEGKNTCVTKLLFIN